MAGVALGIQARFRREALDDERDALRGQPRAPQLVAALQAPERRCSCGPPVGITVVGVGSGALLLSQCIQSRPRTAIQSRCTLGAIWGYGVGGEIKNYSNSR